MLLKWGTPELERCKDETDQEAKHEVMKELLTKIAILGISNAASVGQESIIVRIIEAHPDGVSKIIINDKNGTSSSVAMKPLLFDTPFENALKSNQEAIRKITNKILSKGFFLVSLSTNSKDVLYMLMVFTED
jgi:hypothetical protein